MQKSKSDEKCGKLGLNVDFLISATQISMVRKTPDENQWWGIVDEETMVWKYDFKEEIYALH